MSQTQPPSIDFEAQLPYWINRAGFLLRKEVQERLALEGIDLSAEEMAILMHLLAEPDQTPTKLADQTVRDRTTVTRLLDGMVKKGLVTRHTDPGDRRRVIVRTTPAAREAAQTIVPVVKGLIADCTEGIPQEDIDVALKVLRLLTGNMLQIRTKN